MRNSVLTRWFAVGALLALAGCGGTSTSTPATSTTPGSADAPAAVAAPVAPPMVVAAGTTIPVTLDQTISTKTGSAGDPFEATVSRNILVDGKVAIAKGARAAGHVTVADSAGRVKGGAQLSFRLDSITVGGAPVKIQTAIFTETNKARGKRTVMGAGGGAAIGAIIGAIAGGGKGAAIGAGAGAGAGTAGAAFTGNRDITFPAETPVNFRLSSAVEIAGE